MELSKSDFDLSAKNILIPPKSVFRQKLLRQSLKFLGGLRWRVYFSENPSDGSNRDYLGLKSSAKPPVVESLAPFERSFFYMLQNLKYRTDNIVFNNKFQKELQTKTKKLLDQNKVIIKGDKSQNWFLYPKEQYDDLMLTNIRKFYRKTNLDKIGQINQKIEHFGDHYGVNYRVRKIKTQDCFINIKDHKPNYERDLPCRLGSLTMALMS